MPQLIVYLLNTIQTSTIGINAHVNYCYNLEYFVFGLQQISFFNFSHSIKQWYSDIFKFCVMLRLFWWNIHYPYISILNVMKDNTMQTFSIKLLYDIYFFTIDTIQTTVMPWTKTLYVNSIGMQELTIRNETWLNYSRSSTLWSNVIVDSDDGTMLYVLTVMHTFKRILIVDFKFNNSLCKNPIQT